jgi:translation elongation factor EF-G
MDLLAVDLGIELEFEVFECALSTEVGTLIAAIDGAFGSTDGDTRSNDSSATAFKTAGFKVLQEAFSKAGLVVLALIMSVEILTPAESLADAMVKEKPKQARLAQHEAAISFSVSLVDRPRRPVYPKAA